VGFHHRAVWVDRDDKPKFTEIFEMTGSGDVVLELATPRDAVVLSSLLELYSHDLSDLFALEPGIDGRFGYERLPLYWSDPENRFPFLIRTGSRLAGFALVTRGPPASDDPNDFDMAEFFVLRRHRRSGVGRRAAFLLWNRFVARWIVRVSEGNQQGLQFWARVIAEYASGAAVETTRSGSPHAWRVFAFNSSMRVTGSTESSARPPTRA
jgi:predicted acetyltransferase